MLHLSSWDSFTILLLCWQGHISHLTEEYIMNSLEVNWKGWCGKGFLNWAFEKKKKEGGGGVFNYYTCNQKLVNKRLCTDK
jgi:hypothetical protein